jgi:hypothetical protein
MQCVSYKDGYKYQLKFDYVTDIGILPDSPIDMEYIALSETGKITIRRGYAWDGPSGPTVDTLNFMRGSLVHDALYQLMREGVLDADTRKEPADRLLQSMCKQDGMTSARAWWVYQGVHLFGRPATNSSNTKPLIKAPKACQPSEESESPALGDSDKS